jgi:serine/threonine protein kinase
VSTNRDGYLGLILSKGILNGRYSSLTPLNVYGGYFSILLKAYDNQKNKEVAIKFYDPAKRNEDYRLKCFHREADLLKQLTGQKNIVEMIDGLSQIEVTLKDVVSGIELKDAYEYVVLELAKGDVGGYIYNNSSEDIKTAIKKLVYFREMCKAVARIHRSKICHRDLKPSNFLIFDKSEIKRSWNSNSFRWTCSIVTLLFGSSW